MAKAYSAPWFIEKAQPLGWDVAERGPSANGHYLAFTKAGVPNLRLVWWMGIGDTKWQFLTGSLSVGLPIRTQEAARYLEAPVSVLAELKAKHHKDVYASPQERSPIDGRVECCAKKPFWFRAGQLMASCPKCDTQFTAEMVK
jgi:hypothetical protein